MFIIEPKLFSIGTISLHGGLFFSYTFNTIVEELTMNTKFKYNIKDCRKPQNDNLNKNLT
jgi:hypothetical protein